MARVFLNLVLAVLAVGVFAAFNGGQAQADEALASWYGPGFEGSPTASGEPYNPYGYTAAHKTLPLGTELVVNYGGNAVQVTVNDRGPYVGDRSLDLSQGAAEAIGLDQAGVDYVEYSYADPSSAYAAEPAPEPVAEPVADAVAEPATYETGTAGQTTAEYAQEPGYEQSYEPAPDTSGASGGYVVQQGDTLSGVAAELGTTVEDLAAANGITDPNFIMAGEMLAY